MEPATSHHLDPTVLVGVAVMLVVAKIGGEIFERLKQPAVLGELFAGIVIGNLVIFGFTGAEPLKTHETIAALAELGVIILLFCGLAVLERGINRVAVGLGMIPRGEVGLIFAGIGERR